MFVDSIYCRKFLGRILLIILCNRYRCDSIFSHILYVFLNLLRITNFIIIIILQYTGFCCCDYRRAVVVMSILRIIFYGSDIISIAISFARSARAYDNIEFWSSGACMWSSGACMYIVVYALFSFCNIVTVWAALKYHICMLSTMGFVIFIGLGLNIYNACVLRNKIARHALLWAEYGHTLDLAESGYGNAIGSIVVSTICYGLYLYPVIGLISEIKNGIMSQETYPREGMLVDRIEVIY